MREKNTPQFNNLFFLLLIASAYVQLLGPV